MFRDIATGGRLPQVGQLVAGWAFARGTQRMICQPATDGDWLSYGATTLVFVLSVRGNINVPVPKISGGVSWGSQAATVWQQTVGVTVVSLPSQQLAASAAGGMVVLLAQEGSGTGSSGGGGSENLPPSPPGTTRLWRAVEPAELADINLHGDYGIHPNSTFKRFAFSESDIDAFIKANPTRIYTKTYIDLPTEKLALMERHADPGGVGRAIGIDVYEHPEFYTWFEKVQIIR